jgi:predicted nuclease of predicted toxin-antitoxin system
VKFKLDENLGTRTLQVFVGAGHDVQTVRSEGLQGRADDTIYDVCRVEQRCLVTLDLDFSNVLRFPPGSTAGIVILRPSRNVSLETLAALARDVIRMVAVQPVEGKLWVVEPGRIRIHESAAEEEP